MKEFKKVNKTLIKSDNTTDKIFNRYLYCLIPFVILIILINIVSGTFDIVLSLLKSILLVLLISIIVQIIFNSIKKDKCSYDSENILKYLFIEKNILTISLIVGLFSVNSSIYITIVSAIVTVVIKNIFSSKTISSTLYGILIILISNHILDNLDTPLTNLVQLGYIDTYKNVVMSYGTIFEYILGLMPYYLSPILSLCSFIYLFYKKSIKYNIVFSYIFTISFIMLVFGFFNGMNIWYLLFQLTTGNLLFLSVFCLGDYPDTPITSEGQVIYGIVLGLFTSVLRFIIPELSVVIPLILGPFMLTKLINKISFKLKYNKKYYYIVLIVCVFCVVLGTVLLNIMI